MVMILTIAYAMKYMVLTASVQYEKSPQIPLNKKKNESLSISHKDSLDCHEWEAFSPLFVLSFVCLFEIGFFCVTIAILELAGIEGVRPCLAQVYSVL